MPDTPQTASTTEAAAPVVEQTPQQADRLAVYEKYYGETAPAAEAAPAPEAAATPAADPQLASVLTTLTQRLEAIESKLTAPPATPAASPTATADWLELLRQGKREEADTALTKMISDRITPDTTQASALEAVELVRAELEVGEFNKSIKSDPKNADLLPFEAYIVARAEQRINAVRAAGKVQSISDYVKIYKDVVNAEVEEARKLLQQVRAAGKNEAQTTQRQVINATTIPPNGASQQYQQNAEPGEPDISPGSYFGKRLERQQVQRGLRTN